MVARQRRSLMFTAPGQVVLRSEASPAPGPGEVRVRSLCSAISAGTELLVYRGQAQPDLQADSTIGALSGSLAYPLKYGYATVGRIIESGPGTHGWQDRRVFAFNPHETEFVAPVNSLLQLPDDLNDEDALFLPNMETAVSLAQDGHVYPGERVVVLGAGVVGLLTTTLLARTPLAQLTVIDGLPLRRRTAQTMGAKRVVDPADTSAITALEGLADVTFELTGSPAALDTAIGLTGYAGRVIIGSWYGTKPVTLDLGGTFHRSRIQLISSQVSTLAPALLARWTKERRLNFALTLLALFRPSLLITHRIPFESAPDAYAMLAAGNPDILQVVLTHDPTH